MRNSDDFNKIKPFIIPDDHTLISLNVSSLLTNVGSVHVRDSLIECYFKISVS